MRKTKQGQQEEIEDLEFRLEMEKRNSSFFKLMFILFAFFLLMIVFLDYSQRVKLEEQINALKEVCHTSPSFCFPEGDMLCKNSLEYNGYLYCNFNDVIICQEGCITSSSGNDYCKPKGG